MRTVWLCVLMVSLIAGGLGQAPKASPTPQPKPAPAQPAPKPQKPAPSAPPSQIKVKFRTEGERWWWTEGKDGTPLTSPQKISELEAALPLPEGFATLWILDTESGNLARFDANELAGRDALVIGRAGWTHVARLQVNVRAQDRPVAAARVSLTDSTGATRTRVLEPTAEGMAVFERVPLGTVKVLVEYGDEQKVSQETRLRVERDARVPVINVALSGEVATLAPPKAAEAQPERRESRIGAIIMYLLAIAVGIGVILFLIRLALRKEQPLADAMQRLGVQLPSVDTGTPSASATATAPPEPDLPPLESAGIAPTAPAPTTSAVPTRLVGLQGAYAGQVFDISADLITIGRDAGNGIVLSNESTVSRRHAQLMRQNGELTVQDLGSTNGTFVNGIRISAPTPLRVGDTVQFGMATFRVE